MIFKSPEYKEVYDTITGNDELVSRLLEKEYLESKSSLMKIYEREQVENMTATIIMDNKSLMENLAQVLYDNSEYIISTSIELLSDNKYKYTELAQALGCNELDEYTYKLIYYTYKYCYVSSFFQNNCKSFLPEYDYAKIQDHEITSALMDSFMKEFDKIDCTISKCASFVDLDNIPYDYISYLTQLLGFDKRDVYAENEKQYRELCKCMVDIFRIKGTNYSFELLFGFLGYNITISEYWFDRRFYFNNTKGNIETDEGDNLSKEYYLTTVNPTMNSNKCFTKPEIVMSSDITEQYSLLEFEELVNEYGPEAVLGYSPFDKSGNIYTGKTYKYFKTNYVYYSVKSHNGENPTESQLNIISKYIELLTPAFIMKNVKVEVYSDSQSENITFDGDGKKDIYGNLINKPVTFQMLDSEMWDSSRKNLYLGDDNDGKDAYYLNDHGEKIYYTNSLSGYSYDNSEKSQIKIFHEPLSYSYLYYNTNRFSGNDGLTRMVGRRLFHYSSTDSNGNITYSWSLPFVAGSDDYYGDLINEVYESTPKSDMVGSSKSIKNILKDKSSKNYYKVDYYTDKPIEDFIADSSSSFNALSPCGTVNVSLNLIDKTSIKLKNTPLETLKYLYGIYRDKYYIANVKSNPSDISDFNTMSEVSSYITYGTGALAAKMYYGCYILCYDETYAYLEKLISPNKYSNGNISQTYVSCYMFNYKEMLRTEDSTIYSADSSYNTIDAFEKYINKLNSLSSSEKASKISEFNFDTLYDIDGKYYYIIMKPSKRNAKSFSTKAAADEYFKNNPSEIYNGSKYYIDSANLYDKNLYSYKYSERKPGCTIYSSADGKLYKLFGISSDNIEEIDFKGRLEIEDNEAKIYLYDQAWQGYDEQADKDDFILYNTYHTINYMNHSGVINRPIKSVCDAEFDADNYENSKYVDVSSSIIKKYVGTSADLVTPSELYKFDNNGKGEGLVSIIEYYTQFKNDSKINYYSSVSEFFIDYYRYIIKDINCYENGIKFPYSMYWNDDSEEYIIDKNETDSSKISLANNIIIGKFNSALYNLKIIKSFITNKSYFTIVTSTNIYSKSELEKIESYLSNPTGTEQVSNAKKYKYIREAVINVIKNSYESTSMNVVYGTDESKYTYSGTEDISGILLSKINISVYGASSYMLSYRLIFTEGSYNQDYFGEYLDCYSKFANIYDIFMSDIDTSTFTDSSCDFSKYKSGCDASTRRNKIDSFLKYIYYSKMVELYREKSFDENIDGLSIEDHNSNNLTSKLSETLGGKAGNLMLTSTLSSLKENNGGKNDKIVKIPFEICAYTTTQSGTEFKFYIRKNDMVRTSGMMFNEEFEKFLAYNTDITYKMSDGNGGTSMVYDYTLRRKAIEEGYLKKAAVIKPVFFNDTSDQTSKLAEEGKLKAGEYFNKNIRKLVEKDHDDITITNFPAMDFSSVSSFQDFVEYTKPSNWMLSIKDKTEYYILSYKDESVTPSSYPDLVNVTLGSDDDSILSYLNSNSTNEGYIEINNLNSSLIDNYVSIPQSREWVDINADGKKDEFISFGDDREINVEIDNKYFDNDDQSKKNEIFDTYINDMCDPSNKAVLSVKDSDGKIGDYKYYNRDALEDQYNLSYTYTEGEDSGVVDSKGNKTYKVPFSEEQEYKIGKEYKKDYRVKIYENASGDILLETSRLFMGNITSITLLYNIVYISFKTYKKKIWMSIGKSFLKVSKSIIGKAISLKAALKPKISLGKAFDANSIASLLKIRKNNFKSMRSVNSNSITIYSDLKKIKQIIGKIFNPIIKITCKADNSTINTIREFKYKLSCSFSIEKTLFEMLVRNFEEKGIKVVSNNISTNQMVIAFSKSKSINVKFSYGYNIIQYVIRALEGKISSAFKIETSKLFTGFKVGTKKIKITSDILSSNVSEGVLLKSICSILSSVGKTTLCSLSSLVTNYINAKTTIKKAISYICFVTYGKIKSTTNIVASIITAGKMLNSDVCGKVLVSKTDISVV